MARTFSLFLFAILLVAGCDEDDPPAPAPPPQQQTPPPGGTTPPPAAVKKANRITGSITDERGNVIAIPGVKFEVSANGVQEDGPSSINVPTNADGTIDFEVPPGFYQVSAYIQAPFNGGTFRLFLQPVQDNSAKQPSSEGIVQNFVWKLTGANRPDPDPNIHTHWYGASVQLNPRPESPDGTQWEFVFTPTQPTLIDGSAAKVLTLERTYAAYLGGNLTDIPIGVYELSGSELRPGGVRTPLLFTALGSAAAPAVPIEFRPNEPEGALTNGIDIAAQEP